jgi:hypothetical protein
MISNSCKYDLPFILWDTIGYFSRARPSLRLNDRRHSNFCKDFLELLVQGR